MTFPLLWTVEVSDYTPSTEDAHGDAGDSWGEPRTEPVYGWAPPSGDAEPFEAGRNAVVRDLDLYVPPDFTCSPRDLVSVSGVEYEAVGHPQDFNHGPFGFIPGSVVNLKRVEG